MHVRLLWKRTLSVAQLYLGQGTPSKPEGFFWFQLMIKAELL